ncbi:putative methyltransferase DDB_G0268948 [Styela clava]
MAQFYDKRDVVEKYDNDIDEYPDIIHKSIMEFVIKQNKDSEDVQKYDLMLDAGCGSGRSTTMFSKDFKKIIGFDISSEQIRIAKAKNISENIEFVEAKESHMPALDSTVDLITCGFAIQYMDVVKFVQECKRVLKPTGCVVIYAFETSDILPVGKSISAMPALISFINEMKHWSKDHYPPDFEYFCRYENVFQKVSGISKSRENDLEADMFISLADLKAIILAVPGHGMYVNWMKENKNRDTLQELGDEIKTTWGMKNVDDADIKMQMKVSIFTIILTQL